VTRRVLGGLLLLGPCALLALAWLLPLPARLAQAPSTVVRYRDSTPAQVFLSPDDRWRLPADLGAVDPDYLRALVALEDKRFWWHLGVDPLAIWRAALQDLAAGEVVSGASTLTMQLVRVLEPRPRNLRSKALEALRALQLELRLSKEEILAAYLSYVPYGRNLEGLEVASWAMFGHAPAQLSAEEIVTLLAIPQDPNGRYPRLKNQGRLRKARIAAARRLLHVLDAGADEPDPQALLIRVAQGPQPLGLQPLPREIPHAANWMRSQAPETPQLRSTLDRGVQRSAQAILAAERSRLNQLGIRHAAVVVLERDSGALAGLVGGFDFWARQEGAQIPAFAVPRSPGSTLKPLLFARAADRGLALPGFLVSDLPQRFGGYAPRNFDGQHRGMVRLDDALSLSLNLPFVALLEQLGVEDLVGLLRSAGAPSLAPEPGRYGLSLAVGGAEISPLELAALYGSLARGGQALPLRWRWQESASSGILVLSPGACWLTSQVLARSDRPDFPLRAELGRQLPSLRWKTGTSYGHRDAWAAGYGERYVAVVWLGNLDGSASSHLVGGAVAAPLLFDLLEALGDRGPAQEEPPADLVPVQVCSLSGQPAGPHCPHAQEALAPRGHVPTQSCPLHQELEVDLASGEQVGPGCRQGRRIRRELHLVWPAALRRWQAERLGASDELPPLAAGCAGAEAALRPSIVHPSPGSQVLLVPGLESGEQELPLVADYPRPGAQLWWFVDGRPLAQAPADGRSWWTPEEGRHELAVMNAAGRADRLWVEVRRGR